MKKQFPVVVSRGFRNNICSKSRPCFRNSVLKVASKNLAHVFGSKISSSPPAKTPEYNVFFTDRSDVVNVSFLSWVNWRTHSCSHCGHFCAIKGGVITFEQFSRNLKAAEVREYFQTLGFLEMMLVLLGIFFLETLDDWNWMGVFFSEEDSSKAWTYGMHGPSLNSWMKMEVEK